MNVDSFNSLVSAPGILRREDLDSLWEYKFEILGLEFRKLSKNYLEQVQELHHSSFPVKYSQTFYEQLLKGVYVTVLVFHKETDRLVIFGTGRIDNEGNFKKGYIATLGVLDDFRKQGLGILMLRDIEYRLVHDMSEKPDRLELHVGSYNTAAMRMYDKAKFTQIEFLPKHYTWDGEKHDGYVYRKYLNGVVQKPLHAVSVNESEEEKNAKTENETISRSYDFNFCNVI